MYNINLSQSNNCVQKKPGQIKMPTKMPNCQPNSPNPQPSILNLGTLLLRLEEEILNYQPNTTPTPSPTPAQP